MIKMEPYPGWELIIDQQGTMHHVPSRETVSEIQEKVLEIEELWHHDKMINAQLLTENISLKKKLSQRANSPPKGSDDD